RVVSRRTGPARIVSLAPASIARLICGTSPRWAGCSPAGRERIYFANHTSHLDFLVLWASLPANVRARTRPVAGRDYWDRTPLRSYLARRVFNAVLVDRTAPTGPAGDMSHDTARRSVARAARALAHGDSLIIFPEGTRGTGA